MPINTNNLNINGGMRGNFANQETDPRKIELMSELEKVKARERTLNSKSIMEDNRVKEIKIKFIQKLFEIMQEAGVDPNDTASINAFLQELETADPDLRELFEFAFDNLTREEAEESNEKPGLMGQFSNLATSMMMPKQ